MRHPRRGLRATALLACLAALAALAVPALGAAPCSGGYVDVAVPVPDGLSVPDSRVRIVLPAGYDPERPEPYAVVYLLHGVGDTYQTWSQNTDVACFAPDLGAIVVMPDGGRGSEAGWYSDWADGSRDWERFHVEVLVPFIDATHHTHADGAHRAVMGLSMGGFGALSYAARHPDVFSAAASFSGAVDTQYAAPVSGQGFAAANDQFGTPDERVWGPQTTELDERSAWTQHNPTALARRGRLAHLQGDLWLSAGTGTPGGPAGEPANPAMYGVEHVIWQMHQSLRAALVQSGTEHHDLSYLGGGHDWASWQRMLHLVLPEVVASIS